MHQKNRIAIGCDHAGVEYKQFITQALQESGYTIINFGTDTKDSVDYPDYAHPVANAVEKGEADFGILLCGSANGVCITANKHAGIRAALCWNKEVAELARLHNDANIIGLPARFVSVELALDMALLFLETAFEGGRHQNRVAKIACP